MTCSLDSKLQKCFPLRPVPEIDPEQIELEPSLKKIAGLSWAVLPADWFEEVEALIYLTPSQFSYYLPGVLKDSLSRSGTDSAAFQFLLEDLGRSDDPKLWTSGFIQRWGNLSLQALQTVECVIAHVKELEPMKNYYYEAYFDRPLAVLKTLQILKMDNPG